MKLLIKKGVDCQYRENLTSIYRCASCQFQNGGIETGLSCGRQNIEPNILTIEKGKVFCPVRRRKVKLEPICVNCFFHEGSWLGNVKCMAGRLYMLHGLKV